MANEYSKNIIFLTKISRWKFRWLTKQMFVEGIAPHPRHGPKKRWRDSVMGDLQSLGVSDGWLMLA